MSYTVSIPQSAIYTALGNFIVAALGLTAPFVVQNFDNRVPMPNGPFVGMAIMNSKRLRTNVDTIGGALGTDPTSIAAEQGMQVDLQIDCYSPVAADWANILTTLLRDNVGCLALAPNCQPLYADDPIRAPLTNAEEQYEDRWIVTARIQYNPVVATPVQSATALGPVNIVDAEVAYGPSTAP
jgi:hypothetical protein